MKLLSLDSKADMQIATSPLAHVKQCPEALPLAPSWLYTCSHSSLRLHSRQMKQMGKDLSREAYSSAVMSEVMGTGTCPYRGVTPLPTIPSWKPWARCV